MSRERCGQRRGAPSTRSSERCNLGRSGPKRCCMGDGLRGRSSLADGWIDPAVVAAFVLGVVPDWIRGNGCYRARILGQRRHVGSIGRRVRGASKCRCEAIVRRRSAWWFVASRARCNRPCLSVRGCSCTAVHRTAAKLCIHSAEADNQSEVGHGTTALANIYLNQDVSPLY